MNLIDEKEQVLLEELKSYGSIAIAYSGGVDSTYLADVAHEALGHNAMMVIADSPSIPREELQEAVQMATDRGWNLRIIKTEEHLKDDYLENKGDRCFHCKNELFTKMEMILSEFGDIILAHGAIEDDKGDVRPGTQAAANHCVIAPLQNAGLYKKEVRLLSERRGLPTAGKASFACLGSRFPTGTRIELEAMTQVEKAEAILRARGYSQYRIRHHDDLCRIEIDSADFDKMMNERIEIVNAIKKTGYRFVTLDLSGYTMGSSA
ncbi:ATP-dependent sacrificial sulfur transferase LarE [Pontiella agarivorans]|uniref:ATP-dependent sacrificial sulfur transferase LarE n=1 Tax=Pontiella agarivorans TaxID=3038953 RepID=A0ABU5MZQ9_9BACT|nr:ATP-dependent sacrificial sulfur transferase LarE [Pontiella agarivorans]MDZ8119654.1 ATP-dependent sacrificial sulfur transferase LarE [Pontiella agarivorans]